MKWYCDTCTPTRTSEACACTDCCGYTKAPTYGRIENVVIPAQAVTA